MKIIPGKGGRRIEYSSDSRDLILDLGEALKAGVAATDDDYGLLDSNIQILVGSYGGLALKCKTFSFTCVGQTETETDFIPAGAIVLGISARVTTALVTGDNWDLGNESFVNLFGDALANDVDTLVTPSTFLASANWPYIQVAEENLVLTINGSASTAGVVKGIMYYLELTAPTA